MKEKNDVTKMEFLLMLNDNIVVQRYFNVRGYNPKARKSIDVVEFINEIDSVGLFARGRIAFLFSSGIG